MISSGKQILFLVTVESATLWANLGNKAGWRRCFGVTGKIVPGWAELQSAFPRQKEATGISISRVHRVQPRSVEDDSAFAIDQDSSIDIKIVGTG